MYLESLEALRRLRGAAEKAVRRAVVWAPLLAAVLGGASPVRAASSAYLNINVQIFGINGITDLTAAPGAAIDSINLSWTEPFHNAGVAPYAYDVRVSSIAQISNDAAFTAASPLSSVSASLPPSPGAGGGAAGFVVTGLTSNVTYYFAIREKDSLALNGIWNRSLSPARNVNNFAVPTSPNPPTPAAGTITAVYVSSLTANWSVSPSATNYTLVASTNSVFPKPITASSTTVNSTSTLVGLAPNSTYFLYVSACGFGCSPYGLIGSTITLAQPAVSLSTQSISSSTVSLDWNLNGNPAGTFALVQKSSDGVTFATVAGSTVSAADFTDLTGGGTYYYQVIVLNGSGIPTVPSNILTVYTPNGPTPSAPTGLQAYGGLLFASVNWDALASTKAGAGFLYYALQRAPTAFAGYVTIATTTATSYIDKPLAAGATVYYKVVARDIAGTFSSPSGIAAATPYSIRPMEPLGVKVVPSSATVTFSWTPTNRFVDGSAFVSTGAPSGDELMGYSVYRSTNICDPAYVQISTLPVGVNSLTDTTGGLNYYYRLFSYNSVGASTNVVTLSSLAERNYFMDDCATTLVMDDASAATLNGAVNGIGDIRLQRTRRPQDVGNGVYQSAEWRAFMNGVSEMKGWTLPKPARVVLHFDVQNGRPTPSTAATNGFSPQASALGPTPSASVEDLGVYWNNGQEFKKMYGRVDAVAQTVSVETPNLGIYQIRALARSAGVVFDLSNLSSKVITPNGDGLNDTAIFTYDPGPNNVVPEGKIFDLRGGFVSDMVAGLVPDTLTWNGRMSGMPVRSGVYMYRITGGGKTFTGTIVVAR
jgi:hypothetical protein